MPTWTLGKQFTFEAAHRLPEHDGKCQRLHGHSWVGWVEVQSSSLVTEGPKSGMVMDYSDLSAFVAPLVENYLDHHYLNETLNLPAPTSEAVARWVFEYLRPLLGPMLFTVVIEETCTARCRYSA